MASDKDGKAVKALVAKLGPQMKDLKAQFDDLEKLNDENLKLSEKLLSTAKSAKPPLPKNATLGDLKKAVGKLQEQSRLTAASERYAKACDTTSSQLSARSQQRQMLNDLIKYANVGNSQHTGSGHGEMGNRRSTREILLALESLRRGDKDLDAAAKHAGALNRSPEPLSEKTPLKTVDDHLKAMRADRKRIEMIRSSLDGILDTLEQSGEALAGATSAASA